MFLEEFVTIPFLISPTPCKVKDEIAFLQFIEVLVDQLLVYDPDMLEEVWMGHHQVS
jgi:hypothetical protein